MSKTGNAVKSNSAEASQPAARPAVSQAAKGNKGADTGTEIEYDLPNADEVAAFLRPEPAGAADDEDDESNVDGDENDEATAEETAEDKTAGESGADDESNEADDDEADDETSDESDETDESGDDSADESGEETEEDKTAEADADAGKPARVQRIDKLTARAKSAEEENARLREQLASAQYSAPDYGSLATVDDMTALGKAEHNEQSLHEWALLNESNPEGADLPDGKGGTRHFEPDQIRQIKVSTFRALYKHIPARKEYLREKAAADAAALQAYPWLRQVKDGDGAAVQALIEARPYLRQTADYRTIAADAHIGAKLRKAGITLDDKAIAALAKGKAPVNGPTKVVGKQPMAPIVRRTAPSPSRPGVLPPRLKGREAAARAAEKRLQSSDGNLSDLANSIAARMR